MGVIVEDAHECNAISLVELGMPEDVIASSGVEVPLYGDVTGADDEVIVIEQFKRQLYNAYVCHLDLENDGINAYHVINDIPEYPKMVFKNLVSTHGLKEIDRHKFTMICKQDAEYEQARPNWLY